MATATCAQVRYKHTGEMLVLKIIQFDVSSDVLRKQVCVLCVWGGNLVAGQSHPADVEIWETSERIEDRWAKWTEAHCANYMQQRVMLCF